MKRFNRWFWICLLFSIPVVSSAQSDTWLVDGSYDYSSWEGFVSQVESQYQLRFYYEPDSLPSILLTPARQSIPLSNYLQQQLAQLGLQITYQANDIFVYRGQALQSLPKDIYPVWASRADLPKDSTQNQDFPLIVTISRTRNFANNTHLSTSSRMLLLVPIVLTSPRRVLPQRLASSSLCDSVAFFAFSLLGQAAEGKSQPPGSFHHPCEP